MNDTGRKIWITRAQPGADATAERVRALGHRPVVAPLLAVQPVLGAEPDLSGVGALAFTSANGVRAFTALSPDGRHRFRREAETVFGAGADREAQARALGLELGKAILEEGGDLLALYD